MRKFSPAAVVLVAFVSSTSALAHEGHKHTNLKVLTGIDEKVLDKGMKGMAKGLGVKCTACHVDKHWDQDEKKTKLEARAFLDKVVAGPEVADKQAALDGLIKSLEIKGAKDEAKLWEAIALFKHAKKEP